MAGGEPQNERGRALPGPKRAFGRSLADFQIDGAPTAHRLNPAEEKLLICAGLGELCDLGGGVSIAASDQNRVRSGFLRFLLLGGDEYAPVHEKGVLLKGALLEGCVDLENATMIRALSLSCCQISEKVLCGNAQIDGIKLSGCALGSLNFEFSRIEGGVVIEECHVGGELSLKGAKLGGELICKKSAFVNKGEVALNCDGAQFAGDVFLQDGFEAQGQVRFVGARIGGYFICRDASFLNPADDTLYCSGATVGADVGFGNGFRADGRVRMFDAQIGGDLLCRGATFKNPDGIALVCSGSVLAGDVRFEEACIAQGQVQFQRVEIGGDFYCVAGSFRVNQTAPKIPGQSLRAEDALDLTNASIKGILTLGPQVKIDGSLNLQNATARALEDHRSSWPSLSIRTEDCQSAPCVISLDGFTYARIAGEAKTDWETRTGWLKRQRTHHLGNEFRPQPFEQLIKVLRDMGHDTDARRIALLKQSLLQKRRKPWKRPFSWLLGFVFGRSCGYGYRPHRLFVGLVALWIICGLLYHVGAARGGFAPKDGQVWTNPVYNEACYKNWTVCREGGGGKVKEIIAFQPFLYSADMMLPAIDLGQRSAWTPMMRKLQIKLPFGGQRQMTIPPATLRTIAWAENLLGVAGVILIGAILSGIVKRD